MNNLWEKTQHLWSHMTHFYSIAFSTSFLETQSTQRCFKQWRFVNEMGFFLNINIKLERGQTHVRVTCKIPMTHRHPKYCVPIWASGLWIKTVCWFLLFPVIFLRGNKCVIKEFLSFGKCCYYFYFWHMTLSVFMHFCLSSIWCNKPLLLKVSNIWLFANFKQLPNFWHRISMFLMTIKENQLNSITYAYIQTECKDKNSESAKKEKQLIL